ncbi:MAG: carboxypeptidase-like regulatory domain-containing protein [Pyrinomonadaceae bacterium]
MTLQKSISIIFASVFLSMIFPASILNVAAQTSISSGTITGTAVDPNNAVVSGANIEVFNAVTNYRQVAQTDSDGNFRFNNVPFNNYRLTIKRGRFRAARSPN